jgi:hypothetical protein
LWKSFLGLYWRPADATADSAPQDTVSHWIATAAVNYKKNDATVTRAVEPVEFHQMTASRIRRLFSVSNLTGGR